MAKVKPERMPGELLPAAGQTALWELGVAEITSHKFESADRDEVNDMLAQGWILLHIYTLKYRDKIVWRERPMVILGRPAKAKNALSPKK
jgi:hypothetical protein